MTTTIDRLWLTSEQQTIWRTYLAGVSRINERLDAELRPFGLDLGEYEILVNLSEADHLEMRMSELAAQSTVTHSGLTRLIDRMVGAGMVERTPCETDRRGSYAQLTGAGIDLVVGLIPAHLATIDRVLVGPVGLDDLAGFLQALRRIRAVARPMSDPVASASVGLRPTS